MTVHFLFIHFWYVIQFYSRSSLASGQILHMPGLSQVLPCLRGALVEAGLQPHIGVTHPANFLLREIPLVLGRNFRPDPGPAILRVKLGLG